MKKSHIAALFIIAGAIAYIVSTSASYSTYETFETAYSNSGRNFQVIGKLVKDKPMEYNPEEDANYFTFFIEDRKGEVRKVIFGDAKPQDFERSEDVVLTGQMKGEEFLASKILLKCPSKYNNEMPGTMEDQEYTAGS
ncbi:MAG: cytochrome c maturation protein CcmE [Chitinophagales bacterium]